MILEAEFFSNLNKEGKDTERKRYKKEREKNRRKNANGPSSIPEQGCVLFGKHPP
jgi:hypothetical protein